MEWEQVIEHYFEFKDVVDDEKTYEATRVKLLNYVDVCLNGAQRKQQSNGKAHISTDTKLKKKLRGSFFTF